MKRKVIALSLAILTLSYPSISQTNTENNVLVPLHWLKGAKADKERAEANEKKAIEAVDRKEKAAEELEGKLSKERTFTDDLQLRNSMINDNLTEAHKQNYVLKAQTEIIVAKSDRKLEEQKVKSNWGKVLTFFIGAVIAATVILIHTN